MPATAPSPSDRRQRFREWMYRVDPVGDLSGAPDTVLLPRPRPVGQAVATSLELRPEGTHLVLGTIGSGKTTELRGAAHRLKDADPNLTVVFGDLSEVHDVGGVGTGALGLAAAWFLAAETVDPFVTRMNLRNALTVQSPLGFQKRSPEVGAVLREAQRRSGSGIVLFLDGFDRATDAETFRDMVRSELPLFREHRVGLVLTAPPDLTWSQSELEGAWFERIHRCGAFHPADDREFLLAVLGHRIPGAMTPEAADLACAASGGVLRDLVAVARSAIEEAWVSGAGVVGEDHVLEAGLALGRALLADRAAARAFSTAVPTEREPGSFPLLPPTGHHERDLLLRHRLILSMESTPDLLHPSAVQAHDDLPF